MSSCTLRIRRTWLGAVVACWLAGAVPAAAQVQQFSTTDETNYQTAQAAIDAQDYNTAFVYLNQSLSSNSNNGYVYLTRAKLDLLYDLPSTAISDAQQAVSLLRDSSNCDQLLQTNSPLLMNSSSSYYYNGLLNSGSSYGSILNLTSLSGLSSTGSSTATGTSSSSTGSSTGTSSTTTASGTSSTSSGTSSSSSSSSGTSSSTTTASASTFASSSGSQKLPVAEDLTEKDKEKNEKNNEYNETLTQLTMYSAYCGGLYLTNMTGLVDGYTQLGKGYLLNQDYADAQTGFNAALSLDKENAKATAGLGLAYLGQGASSVALTELNTAVTYAPQEPSVYVARGAYWVSVGDYDRANEEYEAAVAQDASYLPAYACFGLLRALQGNYQYALEAYDKALSINGNYVVALAGRAAAWNALAAATSDSALAATYQQKASNDIAQAQKLQETAISVASASTIPSASVYGTLLPPQTLTTGTTTSTTSISTPVIGTFY